MRTAVICSEDNVFNRRVLPAYLASISDLVGIVAIEDKRADTWRRLKHEWRRSRWRIIDVLAFRLFYRIRLARGDAHWVRERAAEELARLGSIDGVPVHPTSDPNSPETRAFLEAIAPGPLRRRLQDAPATRDLRRRPTWDIRRPPRDLSGVPELARLLLGARTS